jgi:hypothetical protein
VTHFHSDHIKGIKHLIDLLQDPKRFTLEELWLPLGFDIADIELEMLKDENIRIIAEFNHKFPNKINLYKNNIHKILLFSKSYQNPQKSFKVRQLYFDLKTIYEYASFSIKCLAPDPNLLHGETINVVRNFLNKYIPPKDDHSSNGNIDRNLRSTVLKLSNSSINLILGGDACNISWEEVISRIKKYQYSPITGEKIKYTSRIIKVSHHGAKNASSEDTLKHILDEKLLHFIFSMV